MLFFKNALSHFSRASAQVAERPELRAELSPTVPLDSVIPAHLQKEAVYMEFKSGCLVYAEGEGLCLFNVYNGWTELVG